MLATITFSHLMIGLHSKKERMCGISRKLLSSFFPGSSHLLLPPANMLLRQAWI